MAGARRVQEEILKAHPEANLRVYAVWFVVLSRDAQERWSPTLLDDPRVVHLWDADGATGRWFLEHITRRPGASIEWDAYFLYPPDARWEVAPGPLASWGRTILETWEGLRRAS